MSIFVTSDLHFGHDREFIWKVRGYKSVDQMNEIQVVRWNNVVKDEDDVYILGDLMLGDPSNIKFLKQLKGRLHIVLGNHDTAKRIEMYKALPNVEEVEWAIMLNYKKYHFYMTHFPCMTGNLEKESLRQMTLNLFGHTHQNTMFYEDRPYMFHVGVDSHNGYPVLLDDVISKMHAKVDECKGFLGGATEEQVSTSKHSDVYKAVLATVNNWPDWKKQVYNECIAISAHAKKIPLSAAADRSVEPVPIGAAHQPTQEELEDIFREAQDGVYIVNKTDDSITYTNVPPTDLPAVVTMPSKSNKTEYINEAQKGERCDKCVFNWWNCGSNDKAGRCMKYKRDPPDGGYYG